MNDESAPRVAASESGSGELQDFLISNAPVLSIAAFFVLVCLTFSIITDSFLTQVNVLNLLRQSAPILIVATAMTFVITTGGIDLSADHLDIAIRRNRRFETFLTDVLNEGIEGADDADLGAAAHGAIDVA